MPIKTDIKTDQETGRPLPAPGSASVNTLLDASEEVRAMSKAFEEAGDRLKLKELVAAASDLYAVSCKLQHEAMTPNGPDGEAFHRNLK